MAFTLLRGRNKQKQEDLKEDVDAVRCTDEYSLANVQSRSLSVQFLSHRPQ